MALSFVKLIENIQKNLEVDALEEFRDHLEIALNRTRKKIQEEYDTLTEEQFEDSSDMQAYQSVLDDRFYMVDQVKNLADELSILALFKHVEIHTKRVVKRHLPSTDVKRIFNINILKGCLPFNLEQINDFDAFEELRLINNAIKHEGKVTVELADRFPSWNQGDKFTNLDEKYVVLLPKLKNYISVFVSEIAKHSEIKT